MDVEGSNPFSRSTNRATGLILAVAVAFTSARGDAQTCAVPKNASAKLASVPASERLELIRATMDEQARYTRIWTWTWVGLGSAAVAASTGTVIGFAASNDPARDANMIDNGVAAVFSLATPIVTVAFAPRIESDELEALLRATAGGAAATCLVLARAEELLARAAADQDFSTSLLAHVVSLLGVGALFGFMAIEAALATDSASRDAHWVNAALNGAIGVAYAEAQILSTPTGASRFYARYLAGDVRQSSPVRASLRPLPGGLAVQLTF